MIDNFSGLLISKIIADLLDHDVTFDPMVPWSTSYVHDCKEIIENSKLILWNGPMGVFEMENFQAGTKSVADAIVIATKKGAFSLIGGGDSVAAINKFNYANEVSYVSTGGVPMLEYLEGIELPGIKAIID